MQKYLFLMLCCVSKSVLAAPDFAEIPYAYLPLTASELGKPFPLTWAGEMDHFQPPRTLTVKAGHASGQLNWQAETEQQPDQALSMTGKDRAGKPWEITLALMRGCAPTRVYHADLDQNGLEDVVLARSTCGNGLAMPTELYIVTFEANGRPILLMLNSYFDDTDKQVAALRDLNQDGNAELLDMSFGNGYWASALYQLHDARWQQVQGQFATRHYPLFTRFTQQPSRTPVQPAKTIFVRDFSNAKPLKTAQLSALTPHLADEQLSSVNLVFTPPAKQTCRLSESWIITQDAAAGRVILTEAAPLTRYTALAKRIKTEKVSARVFGQTNAKGCYPSALWVDE